MTTILLLSGGLVFVVAIFLFLRLREDSQKIRNFLQKHKPQEVEVCIGSTFFDQGLNNVKFEHEDLKAVKQELHKKIIGMEGFINAIILNILCGGHILVEGVPGLAKTKTVHTFAEVIDMDFKRIQFTPDMLPSDVIGVDIFNTKTREFETKQGPVFANIVLADEINRSTPKTQSALLEAMQEKQVTIGGNTIKLPDPFFVLATQNPLEQEGTYPLPEAQIDRFLFKVLVDYPTHDDEIKVLDTILEETSIKIKKLLTHAKFIKMREEISSIRIDKSIKEYITRLVQKTREVNPYVLYGASPRGAIGLMISAQSLAYLEARSYVTHQDVQRVALSVLRHRIVLTYDAKIDGVTEDQLLLELLSKVELY